MELIDKDALLEEMRKLCKWLEENSLSGELPFLQRYINIVEEQPTVDAVPVSFIQQEIDRYYKDEAVTTTGTLNNWIFRSKRLGLQYLIERWKRTNEQT